MLARALALSPFTAGLFAASVTDQSVRGLIKGTGSVLDDAGIGFYRRLASDRAHVDGTLAMMAQWRLDGLLRRLPDNPASVVLVTGDRDLAVPPATSRDAAAALRDATLVALPGLGHLAHEEDPDTIARLIRDALR
jgi:magnesium chelatase accessory protein